MKMTSAYQAHVDGLRAIAILAVVGGHVGIPGFGGGFVGVDIFFVISGYLIIGQIVEALRKGTFSFAGFWARRVLRIMPPMLAMLVTSMAIAPFILVTPAEFREFGGQVFYSALMVVNFYFLDQQNYFDTEAILKPLLHMWSLAVEEQFYLLAPLALFFGWKFRGSMALVFAGLIFALSLAACILLTEPSKNVAFYVVFCRAWEFIAGGALIALHGRTKALAPAVLELLALGGLSAIAISVLQLSETSLFPGYAAILPVAGTVMIIAACQADDRIGVARLLSSPPFVAIGLVSYAWYLWHWPLLSFTRIHNFGEVDLVRDTMAAAVAMAVAIASYLLIEKPCRALRHSPLFARASRSVVAGGALATVALLLGTAVYSRATVATASNNIAEAMRPEKNTKIMGGDPCWMRDPHHLPDGCRAAIGERKVAVLVGDSHARMLYPALKQAADRHGVALISLWRTGCSPFTREPGTLLKPQSATCENYAQIGLRTLERQLPSPPDMLIAGVYWGKVVHGVSYAEYRYGAGPTSHSPERLRQFTATVSAFIDHAKGAGVGQVVIVGPTAEFVRLPVECLARANAADMPASVCGVARSDLFDWVRPALSLLQNIVEKYPATVVVDAMDVFCPDRECSPFSASAMYFTDTHHVSAAGAEHMLRMTPLGMIFGGLGDVANLPGER